MPLKLPLRAALSQNENPLPKLLVSRCVVNKTQLLPSQTALLAWGDGNSALSTGIKAPHEDFKWHYQSSSFVHGGLAPKTNSNKSAVTSVVKWSC